MNASEFDFGSALKELRPRGGRIRLEPVRYDLEEPWTIDQPCVFLDGDVWAYSSDPNGVFESRCGTQLRLRGRSFPALSIGQTHTAEGCVVRDIGIQGDIEGMDTRPLLDLDMLLDGGQKDQCRLHDGNGTEEVSTMESH